jgi:hypothetical protein
MPCLDRKWVKRFWSVVMNYRFPAAALLIGAVSSLGACTMEKPHEVMHKHLLDLAAPIGVPKEAELLFYGPSLPGEIALPGPGTLYAVKETPASVDYVQWVGKAQHDDWMISSKLLPAGTDRLYFIIDRAAMRHEMMEAEEAHAAPRRAPRGGPPGRAWGGPGDGNGPMAGRHADDDDQKPGDHDAKKGGRDDNDKPGGDHDDDDKSPPGKQQSNAAPMTRGGPLNVAPPA